MGNHDMKSMHNYQHSKKRGCSYYFMKLDFEILKPLLIYKYDRQKMHQEDDFVEYMMNDGNILGSIYGQIDPEVLQQEDDKRVTATLSKMIEHNRLSHSHDNLNKSNTIKSFSGFKE